MLFKMEAAIVELPLAYSTIAYVVCAEGGCAGSKGWRRCMMALASTGISDVSTRAPSFVRCEATSMMKEKGAREGPGGPGTLSTDATKGDRQKLAIPAHTISPNISSAIWRVQVMVLSRSTRDAPGRSSANS